MQTSIKKQLEGLTNEGMLDLMYHQFKRFQKVQSLTHVPYIAVWTKWVRR